MDINIIISGNLTGFSRFYATPNANDLYADAKFDFDYRNFLTFLNNGEKAYAISFAPHVVSVSLITRILDSFRRPGILVVSILLQRGMIVDSMLNPQNKNALYQLLNDINDKFYERNFMNGMINQNAAVLMQDYYSDILSNYRLTSDLNQRKVNGNIEVNTPNKRLGYIAYNDIDMPLYLSSLYRRSYEGFHHVFFATNAPQNIEETPEEVVMYRVYITNNKITLPTLVKLTDQIYKLNPNLGEIGFDQNYTYGDVLQGKAGTQIRASIVGETLEVSYRFKEEEKTIHFVFEDKGNIVSLTHIAPVIVETDGTKVPLSTESFKFIGKEIYGRKILQSTNPQYSIRTEYSTIDLQRLSDGATCHIQVESSCVLEMRFSYPYDVPKTIKLKRRNTNQGITIPNVTSYLNRPLPGELTEWDYTIESKEYQTASGHLGNQQQLILHPKPVTNAPVTTVRPGNNISHDTSIKNVSQKGTLKLSDGSDNKKESTKENKLNIKKVLLVAMPLFVILLYVGISWQFNIWPWDNDTQGGESPIEPDITEFESVTKTVIFKFIDCTNDYLDENEDYKKNKGLEPNVSLSPVVDDNIEDEWIGNQDTTRWEYTALENCDGKIHCKVLFDKITICDSVIQFDKIKNNQIVNLKLNVRTSAIVLYQELLNIKEEQTSNNWNRIEKNYKNSIKKDANPNSLFIDNLKDLYDKVKQKYAPSAGVPPISENTSPTTNVKVPEEEVNKIREVFDKVILEYGKLPDPENEAERTRRTALEKVLMRIKAGRVPDNSDNLSSRYVNTDHKYQLSQKSIVDDLINTFEEQLKDDSERKEFSKALKEKKSLFQAYDLVEKYNKERHKINIKRRNRR